MTAARDRPLLFSAPMVRAILDGRKTQTRRIIKPQPPDGALYAGIHYASCEPDSWFFNGPGGRGTKARVRWRPGDRAWVREAWAQHTRAEDRVYAKGDGHPWGSPIYRATFGAILAPACEGFTPWRSPIHMPRWASRLTLMIEDVRVQRLQDISEEDARAEGIVDGGCLSCGRSEPCGCAKPKPDARDSFANLWSSIHGPGAWGANPWVCALSFRAIRANIDALDATTPSGERG